MRMPRKKEASKHYNSTDEEFANAVKNSYSINQVLRTLGLNNKSNGGGGWRKVFKLRVVKLNLDISHFTGQGYLKGKKHSWGASIPLDEILIKDSGRVLHSHIKNRIIKNKLIDYKCALCGLENVWQNKPVTLQIDHINGDSFDHRLENLRILCPNCHAQTDTYVAKNRKKLLNVRQFSKAHIKKTLLCSLCNKERKDSRAKYCVSCYHSQMKTLIQVPENAATKIKWPSVEELEKDLKHMNFVDLGKKLGVTGSAVRKHLKKIKFK